MSKWHRAVYRREIFFTAFVCRPFHGMGRNLAAKESGGNEVND
jgi:hypothetical protein